MADRADTKPPYVPPKEAGSGNLIADYQLSAAEREKLNRMKELRPKREITRDILIAAYQDGYFSLETLCERTMRAFWPLPGESDPLLPGERQMWLGYVIEQALSKRPKERPKQRPPLSPAIRELACGLLWMVRTYEKDEKGKKVSREKANARVVEILKDEAGLTVSARTIERLKPKKPLRQKSK